jgi:hypothetical protein
MITGLPGLALALVGRFFAANARDPEGFFAQRYFSIEQYRRGNRLQWTVGLWFFILDASDAPNKGGCSYWSDRVLTNPVATLCDNRPRASVGKRW